MFRNYNILFSINAQHGSFLGTSGISNNIDLIPTPECQQLLGNYDLLFKALGQQYLVFYQQHAESANELGTIRRPIEEPIRLSFKLKLRQNDLYPFYSTIFGSTDLMENNRLVFTNLNVLNGAINENRDETGNILLTAEDYVSINDALPVYPARTSIPVNGNEIEHFLVQQPGIGTIPQNLLEYEVKEGQIQLLLNFQSLKSGQYVLEQVKRNNGVPVMPQKVWVDKERNHETNFGYVELFLDPAELYNAAIEYQINFNLIKNTWKYFVVTSDKLGVSQEENLLTYKLIYKAERNRNHKRYYQTHFGENGLTFKEIPLDQQSALDRDRIAAYAPKRVIVFESELPIPLYVDKQMAGLELQKIDENSRAKTIIEHLPNPGRYNFNQEIFINL